MPVCLTQCCADSVLNKHIKDSLCELEKTEAKQLSGEDLSAKVLHGKEKTAA